MHVSMRKRVHQHVCIEGKGVSRVHCVAPGCSVKPKAMIFSTASTMKATVTAMSSVAIVLFTDGLAAGESIASSTQLTVMRPNTTCRAVQYTGGVLGAPRPVCGTEGESWRRWTYPLEDRVQYDVRAQTSDTAGVVEAVHGRVVVRRVEPELTTPLRRLPLLVQRLRNHLGERSLLLYLAPAAPSPQAEAVHV